MSFKPLNAEEHFSQNPLSVDMKRSTFDRSFNHTLTMKHGLLVPLMVDEIYPGDTIEIDTNLLIRLLAPVTPVMDDLYFDCFGFFVPNRLLWDHWKEFCGENNSTYWTQPTVYNVPTMSVPYANRSNGDLLDHMGIPMPNASSAVSVNALYPRAYLKVWNDWYRNEVCQAPQLLSTADTQTTVINTLLPVNRAHDYFGSAFPSPQKGTQATVALKGTIPVASNVANANASGSTANVSVNDIRIAFAEQRVMEKLSYGSRYIEMVAEIFGVRSPDARVQRSEFLGSGRIHIKMADVVQTSGTDSGTGATTTPQGTVTGYSKTTDRPLHIFKSFTEHGILLILACARHRRSYAQGINRIFTRKKFLDYYMPTLAHLPPQEIYNKEIYCNGLTQDDYIFAYQERWAELRYKPSYASGLINPRALGTLGLAWTYVDNYSSAPTFDGTWIQEGDAEVMRTMAVTTQDPYLVDAWFTFKHTRVMPVFSVPGLVDHF